MKIGIDIVKTSRFARLVKKTDFLNKHFCENELKHFESKKQSLQTLAGIFCAKEAFLKALGIGVLNGIKLSEVEICHGKNGEPVLNVSDEFLKKFEIKEAKISITHDGGFAAAVCIIS